jgi:hypothetical protein
VFSITSYYETTKEESWNCIYIYTIDIPDKRFYQVRSIYFDKYQRILIICIDVNYIRIQLIIIGFECIFNKELTELVPGNN